ncbi:MAG: hypothetical protein MJA84_06105, partial [Firmicutes bacterium]|nr:hypothetical protein [Bacillota bacterium]
EWNDDDDDSSNTSSTTPSETNDVENTPADTEKKPEEKKKEEKEEDKKENVEDSSDNKEKSDEESKNPEPSANEVADANDTSTSQKGETPLDQIKVEKPDAIPVAKAEEPTSKPPSDDPNWRKIENRWDHFVGGLKQAIPGLQDTINAANDLKVPTSMYYRPVSTIHNITSPIVEGVADFGLGMSRMAEAVFGQEWSRVPTSASQMWDDISNQANEALNDAGGDLLEWQIGFPDDDDG